MAVEGDIAQGLAVARVGPGRLVVGAEVAAITVAGGGERPRGSRLQVALMARVQPLPGLQGRGAARTRPYPGHGLLLLLLSLLLLLVQLDLCHAPGAGHQSQPPKVAATV